MFYICNIYIYKRNPNDAVTSRRRVHKIVKEVSEVLILSLDMKCVIFEIPLLANNKTQK